MKKIHETLDNTIDLHIITLTFLKKSLSIEQKNCLIRNLSLLIKEFVIEEENKSGE
jgi:hypothetical protein